MASPYFVACRTASSHLRFALVTDALRLNPVVADDVLDAPVKTEDAVQDFIQCAMHVEGQKFGALEIRNPKGIQLTSREYRALCAVQQILSRYRYEGNRPDPVHPGQKLGRVLDGRGKFRNVSAVYDHDIRTTEYFDAFGVAKVKQSVGGQAYQRYSPRHAADAMEALHSVANKRFEISYRKRLLEKPRNRRGESYGQPLAVWTQVTAIVTLLKITPYQEGEGRSHDSHEPIQRRYLRRLIITPEPFLIDQLHSYYTLKPANYHLEVDPWAETTSSPTPRRSLKTARPANLLHSMIGVSGETEAGSAGVQPAEG